MKTYDFQSIEIISISSSSVKIISSVEQKKAIESMNKKSMLSNKIIRYSVDIPALITVEKQPKTEFIEYTNEFFLNNLTSAISDTDLKNYFLKTATSSILSIRILKNSHNRFYGFILFEKNEKIAKKITINNVEIDVEKIKDKPKKEKENLQKKKNRKIFKKNIINIFGNLMVNHKNKKNFQIKRLKKGIKPSYGF